MSDFYDLKAKRLDGTEVSFSDFKGKAVLIVNVALVQDETTADEFEQMNKLVEMFEGQLVVLAFPCIQFSPQKMVPHEVAAGFKLKAVMFDTVEVNGEGEHAVFSWLKAGLP